VFHSYWWEITHLLKKRGNPMQDKGKEDLKMKIEGEGLVCDCGGKVYEVGKGDIEKQPNYNKYFEYLECPRCKKVYYL
jgi:uncharacterized protein with PIN domain